MQFTPEVKAEYETLFATCQIKPTRLTAMDAIITRVLANRPRYEAIGDPLQHIPWYFIAALHNLETSLRFDRHFHNGDPLTARTVRVPAGKPATGTPPFTFEASAMDALTEKGFHQKPAWPLAKMLFRMERYNGFGYRNKGIHTPYLWSFSNQYTRGKFVADGEFSFTAISAQGGGATLLKRMEERGLIRIPLAE